MSSGLALFQSFLQQEVKRRERGLSLRMAAGLVEGSRAARTEQGVEREERKRQSNKRADRQAGREGGKAGGFREIAVSPYVFLCVWLVRVFFGTGDEGGGESSTKHVEHKHHKEKKKKHKKHHIPGGKDLIRTVASKKALHITMLAAAD